MVQNNNLTSKANFKLENHILLAKFIANKLGMKQISDIKQFSEVKEGVDADGRSHLFYAILGKKGNMIPEDKLRKYDDHIRLYFEKIRKKREKNFSLKYYQYLALLFSEIYLDSYFQNPIKLLNELNEWVENTKSDNYFSKRPDLQKIAYWMATGSGKTIVMHANYWQFLAYNKGSNKIDYDNIILVTSSEEMSKQHSKELAASGIPAVIFKGDGDNSEVYFEGKNEAVKVVSIHKLKLPEDKKGEGVTIDVSSLGSKNLVFVDEGHKGQKSEDMKWKKTREELARNGFTFEYSATFGQAIDSSNEESFSEYCKAILFDYSYKYFYRDGYGKDFRVLNLESKVFSEKQTKILLLANAMVFYEQLLQFEASKSFQHDYFIERPLWIFIGSKVQKELSDILKVVKFYSWLLSEDRRTIETIIDNILRGQSGILSGNKDIFAPRNPERNFIFLREKRITSFAIFNGLLEKVFNVSPETMGRRLHLIDIKEAEGEIGLRVGNSHRFFAVINIGDKGGFLKLIEREYKEISVEKEAISQSLFESVKEQDSSINMLVGSKKFIEGWNSWRVSTMSLLYIGKGAGPQIIQLFGRGVRLKGKNLGLKRSRFVEPPHPQYIEILETLQIFGIQANYMKAFKEMIEKEDVPTYEISLSTKKMQPFPNDLETIGLKEGWSFKQELIKINPSEAFEVKLDLVPRASVFDARGDRSLTTETPQNSLLVRKEILDILDWDDIYLRLIEFKKERGIFNIAISLDDLKDVVYGSKCRLFCDQELIEPESFESIDRLSDIIVLMLQKYVASYYSKKRNSAEKTHIQLKPLDEADENVLSVYRIQLNEEDQVLAKNIEELIKTGKIYSSAISQKLIADLKSYIDENPTTFKNAYFIGHLYQPLLVKQNSPGTLTIPTGLNSGEASFIEDLRTYLTTSTKQFEIYLLRNLTRSKGVGFYEEHSFYPDFIMWIKKDSKQTIVFIDPKGLTHMGLTDPKLQLHKYLKQEIQKQIGKNEINLNAFVISVTPFRDLARIHGQHLSVEYFEREKHVLFQSTDASVQNKSYIERMFEIIEDESD